MTDWTLRDPAALSATVDVAAIVAAYLERYGTDAYMEVRAVILGHAHDHGWQLIETEARS